MMAKNKSKVKDLQAVINAELKKKYGDEKNPAPELMTLNEMPELEFFSLGSIAFDNILLPRGGLPRGVFVELYGEPSGGKTSLALILAARCQRQGGMVAYIDLEQTLDVDYARALGVNVDELLVIKPTEDTLGSEKALHSATEILKHVDMLVIDSIGAAVPAKVAESKLDKTVMAPRAMMLNRILPLLLSPARRNNPLLLLINQVRISIGAFGDPETAPGGKQHDHLLSLQIKVTAKKNKDLVAEDPITGLTVPGGHTITLKITKSKIGRPGGKCELNFLYPIGEQAAGLDEIGELLSLGESTGALTKDKNTYFLGEVKLGVSKLQARSALADEKLRASLRQAILVKLGDKPIVYETDDVDMEDENAEE